MCVQGQPRAHVPSSLQGGGGERPRGFGANAHRVCSRIPSSFRRMDNTPCYTPGIAALCKPEQQQSRRRTFGRREEAFATDGAQRSGNRAGRPNARPRSAPCRNRQLTLSASRSRSASRQGTAHRRRSGLRSPSHRSKSPAAHTFTAKPRSDRMRKTWQTSNRTVSVGKSRQGTPHRWGTENMARPARQSRPTNGAFSRSRQKAQGCMLAHRAPILVEVPVLAPARASHQP